MAIIRPSTDLRNKYKEISELCKVSQEPVYITVNGKEDTAIISSKVLDELYQTINLMQKINEGIADVNAGKVVSLEEAKKILL
ncbi:MAG: type II toxin-antitoxin system Phd/YefM family antitoxin [Acholeplasmatales bacterium]|nr:type II toxin-antitoxin system Phd/YefM family antitoxin [Acholeplasmatales bacterium]